MTISESNFILAKNLFSEKNPIFIKAVNENFKDLFFRLNIPDTTNKYIVMPSIMSYFVYKDFVSFESILSKGYSEFFAKDLESKLNTTEKSLSKFERIRYSMVNAHNPNELIQHQKGLVAEHPIDRNSARHQFKKTAKQFSCINISIENNRNFIFATKKIYSNIILVMNEIRVFSTETGKGPERYENAKVVRNDGKTYECFYTEVLLPAKKFIDDSYSFINSLKYSLYDDDGIIEKLKNFIDKSSKETIVKELLGEI